MITLTYLTTVLQLGNDLIWSDKNAYSPIVEKTDRSLTGALIVQQSVKTAGQPITLQSDGDTFGLLTRSIVDQLYAWQAMSGITLALDFHGTNYSVGFRYDNGAAVIANPVFSAGAPTPTDLMTVTIKLRML
ncbi:MAG: hypothetical protein ACYC3A_05690 [Halothiobacillus sp.]